MRKDIEKHEKYGGEVRQLIVFDTQTGKTTTTDYIIVKHNVPVTHASTKRPNIGMTEVVLAFPVDSGGPILRRQYAYNFLPIRMTSFLFLIQADFLLSANREDLDDSHAGWNDMLLEGITQAFKVAASRFGSTPLKYSWIRFLPLEEEPCSSFKTLSNLIRLSLQDVALLISARNEPLECSRALYLPMCLDR